jgi:hypothetical protein
MEPLGPRLSSPLQVALREPSSPFLLCDRLRLDVVFAGGEVAFVKGMIAESGVSREKVGMMVCSVRKRWCHQRAVPTDYLVQHDGWKEGYADRGGSGIGRFECDMHSNHHILPRQNSAVGSCMVVLSLGLLHHAYSTDHARRGTFRRVMCV